MLSRKARTYITLVVASGATVMLFAAGSYSSTSVKSFAIYIGLAALASTLKVRIPGMESTLSPNFVFLLLAMSSCHFSEVVAISFTAALVQSLYRPAKAPHLVQVAFSGAALVLSSSASYGLTYALLARNGWESSVACLILSGCIYFPLNSVLVAIVLGLAAGEPVKQLFTRLYQWVFPYVVGGIAFAGIVSGAYVHSSAWKGAVVLVPAAVLAHVYFLHRSTHKIVSESFGRAAKEECRMEVVA